VVLDLLELRAEIEEVRRAGIRITPKELGIAYRAPLILPTHRLLDGVQEETKKGNAVGTTKRGIGPAYSDLALRTALLFADVFSADWPKKLERAIFAHEEVLEKIFNTKLDSPCRKSIRELEAIPAFFEGFQSNVNREVSEALGSGKKVLFEGAQGSLLDNSFGTYPFVTSSHPIAGGACVGVGVPPQSIGRVEAVVKAYCTRVGSGPFVTELFGKVADELRQRGGEFGTTTGRPRRTGWLDLVALRYANRLNGFAGMHVTKLDVLAGQKEILFCNGYEVAGKAVKDYPADPLAIENARPVYEKVAGFGDVSQMEWAEIARQGKTKGLAALPKNALAYVKKVSELSEMPVISVSVGPERESIIFSK
jgi:adenylosuccinate synthase